MASIENSYVQEITITGAGTNTSYGQIYVNTFPTGSVIVLKSVSITAGSGALSLTPILVNNSQLLVTVATNSSGAGAYTIWSDLVGSSSAIHPTWAGSQSVYLAPNYNFIGVTGNYSAAGTVTIALNFCVILPTDPTTGLSSPIVNNFLNNNGSVVTSSSSSYQSIYSFTPTVNCILVNAMVAINTTSLGATALVTPAIVAGGATVFMGTPVTLSGPNAVLFNIPVYLTNIPGSGFSGYQIFINNNSTIRSFYYNVSTLYTIQA